MISKKGNKLCYDYIQTIQNLQCILKNHLYDMGLDIIKFKVHKKFNIYL